MRLLSPGTACLPIGTELTDEQLAVTYGAPSDPWLRCNMVTTLDGAANGPDGRTGSINTEADHVVFELLRGLSHAVVVGAGTVRAEGYPPLQVRARWRHLREVTRDLPLVVVSRSGDVPATVRDSAPGRVLFATCADAPGLQDARSTLGDDVLVHGTAEVDLVTMVEDLHARGLTQLLTEGGPSLLGAFLAADLVDELCFTVAPLVVGGEHPRPVGPLGAPSELHLETLVEGDGSLMGRWFTRARR